MAKQATADPIAVIDIGSNSARLVIYHRENGGQLRILGSSRAALRLVRDVDRDRRLSPESMEATLKALADFHAMILAYGARRTVVVATAAVRDAGNAMELIERARTETGLRIELIDAKKEAYHGALGGIRALPVNRGALFDLGGGSVQIIEFHNRTPGVSRSLPLGSLRLSQAFLRHDPPTKREVRLLTTYVRRTLDEMKLTRLGARDVLVGVGGTIRNLAKMDGRLTNYPIARIHGYVLTRTRLAEMVKVLCQRRPHAAKSIAGLSRERSDSIIGGALAIQELVDVLGASNIVVSGEGVREGLAYSLASRELPSEDDVRNAAVLSLATRFNTWNPDWAKHRAEIATKLLNSLDWDASAEVHASVEYAALLLDIGRSVDFFDRYEHAAAMVINTELDGFSHRQIALLSAIIDKAGDEDARPHSYRPLVEKNDVEDVERAAIVLRIADEMQQRWPKGIPVRIAIRAGRTEVVIRGQGLAGWTMRGVGSRFERVFGRRLVAKNEKTGK
jgi:exopolyphosphatase/guanosine-5'-triphosphate,3'-diphosphate pyrophosphatase